MKRHPLIHIICITFSWQKCLDRFRQLPRHSISIFAYISPLTLRLRSINFRRKLQHTSRLAVVARSAANSRAMMCHSLQSAHHSFAFSLIFLAERELGMGGKLNSAAQLPLSLSLCTAAYNIAALGRGIHAAGSPPELSCRFMVLRVYTRATPDASAAAPKGGGYS